MHCSWISVHQPEIFVYDCFLFVLRVAQNCLRKNLTISSDILRWWWEWRSRCQRAPTLISILLFKRNILNLFGIVNYWPRKQRHSTSRVDSCDSGSLQVQEYKQTDEDTRERCGYVRGNLVVFSRGNFSSLDRAWSPKRDRFLEWRARSQRARLVKLFNKN